MVRLYIENGEWRFFDLSYVFFAFNQLFIVQTHMNMKKQKSLKNDLSMNMHILQSKALLALVL